MIRMQCPGCHKRLGVTKLDPSGVVICPLCRRKFRLVRKQFEVVEEDAVEIVEDDAVEVVEEDAVEIVEDDAVEVVEDGAVEVVEEAEVLVLEPAEEALEPDAEVVEDEAKLAKTGKLKKASGRRVSKDHDEPKEPYWNKSRIVGVIAVVFGSFVMLSGGTSFLLASGSYAMGSLCGAILGLGFLLVGIFKLVRG